MSRPIELRTFWCAIGFGEGLVPMTTCGHRHKSARAVPQKCVRAAREAVVGSRTAVAIIHSVTPILRDTP